MEYDPADRTGLVNPRTGVVTELRAAPLHPHLPAPLRLWLARPADIRCFGPWPGEPVTSGCAWWDDGQARAAALGEAVERYCAAFVPPGLPRATPAEMTAQGRDMIELTDLALFSAAQHRSPGFPFVAFTPDLPVRWVSGRDLLTGGTRAVPIGLVYTTVHRGQADDGVQPCGDEPPTNPVPYAGLAAGRCREQAEFAALLELIERDAVTRGWLRAEPWPEISVDPPLADLFRGPLGALRVRLFLVPGAVGVPVLAALVDDRVTGLLALGSAARTDPVQAALKAVAEAAQLHLMLHELDDPNSALMRLAAADRGCPLRPWRADRRYRDSYRADWRDVRDLACQLQLYLDPAMRAPLLDRFATQRSIRLADVPAGEPRSVPDIARALDRIGVQAVSVDLSTADVRSCGWRAVRVVAAGLYPNTPPAFPPLGGRRLHEGRLPAVEHPLPMPYA